MTRAEIEMYKYIGVVIYLFISDRKKKKKKKEGQT